MPLRDAQGYREVQMVQASSSQVESMSVTSGYQKQGSLTRPDAEDLIMESECLLAAITKARQRLKRGGVSEGQLHISFPFWLHMYVEA